MAKYRSKPVTIEATQWFKNGDHPEDNCETITATGSVDLPAGTKFKGEGKVVRYYRHLDVSGKSKCISSIPCEHIMHDHGWIDTPEGGHTVCPGDWVITGLVGEKYPCKDSVFRMKYEPVE